MGSIMVGRGGKRVLYSRTQDLLAIGSHQKEYRLAGLSPGGTLCATSLCSSGGSQHAALYMSSI